jgi:hypothetical protein
VGVGERFVVLFSGGWRHGGFAFFGIRWICVIGTGLIMMDFCILFIQYILVFRQFLLGNGLVCVEIAIEFR